MNILLLDFGLELRGGQRQVLYLAAMLKNSVGFNPILVSRNNAPILEPAKAMGLHTETINPNPLLRKFGLRKLQKIMAESPGKWIIHTNDSKSASFGAFMLAKCPDCLLLHTRRVSYPIKQGARGAKYRKAHAVACVSQEIAEVMMAGQVAPEKIRVIHSGINLELYPEHKPRNDSRVIFVIVGALTEQKGHETLIKALGHLVESNLPLWELRIIGHGPLFGKLLELSRELHVEHLVSFLGHQDSRMQLQHCDIMVVPSVSGEGSSAAIKEAWATGIPLVCSDLPSNLELLKPEENGLGFPVCDHDALASQLVRLCNDDKLCKKLVLGGKNTINDFTHTRMAEEYMLFYRELESCSNQSVSLSNGKQFHELESESNLS